MDDSPAQEIPQPAVSSTDPVYGLARAAENYRLGGGNKSTQSNVDTLAFRLEFLQQAHRAISGCQRHFLSNDEKAAIMHFIGATTKAITDLCDPLAKEIGL